MNHYIQKALQTYCDDTQTSEAKATARQILINAGMSMHDLERASHTGAEQFELYLFAA